MKKLFGQTKLTWLRVILCAVVTALYTGIALSIEFLDNTSFQDIGVYLEWWFLFGIIIVVNSEKWWEASLKCFVFFLISQPLIYLVQVPFNTLGWGIFMYYKRWFVITLLTLPGAAVGFLLEKKNWISSIVLCVPILYFANATVSYFAWAMRSMPRHILSAIFCLAMTVLLPIYTLDEKKHRALPYIIAILMIAGCVVVPGLRLI